MVNKETRKNIAEISSEIPEKCKEIVSELKKYSSKRDLNKIKDHHQDRWMYYLNMTNHLWRRLPENRGRYSYDHSYVEGNFDQLPKNRLFSFIVYNKYWGNWNFYFPEEIYLHFFGKEDNLSGALYLHKFKDKKQTKYAIFDDKKFKWTKKILENTEEHTIFSKILNNRTLEVITGEINMNIGDLGFRLR